ncbi:prorelaxin H1 [Engraulis encrasicolus]|uniref:prorelaxin H1 n=1 Tax=Engraulis encrasicolus TaxID=184585 RepID=UPI002FD6DA64
MYRVLVTVPVAVNIKERLENRCVQYDTIPTSILHRFVVFVAVVVSADSSNKGVLSKDYGVRLCGREFIRAVIFTCGGSRWKRVLDLDLLLNRNRETHDDQKRSDVESRDRPAAGSSGEPEVDLSSAGLDLDSYISKLHFERRKRTFAHGLAGICCNEGCTKNDIGRFC